MDFILKMMDFILKTMDFAGCHGQPRHGCAQIRPLKRMKPCHIIHSFRRSFWAKSSVGTPYPTSQPIAPASRERSINRRHVHTIRERSINRRHAYTKQTASNPYPQLGRRYTSAYHPRFSAMIRSQPTRLPLVATAGLQPSVHASARAPPLSTQTTTPSQCRRCKTKPTAANLSTVFDHSQHMKSRNVDQS